MLLVCYKSIASLLTSCYTGSGASTRVPNSRQTNRDEGMKRRVTRSPLARPGSPNALTFAGTHLRIQASGPNRIGGTGIMANIKLQVYGDYA